MGCSAEANPEYVRDVSAQLGLKDDLREGQSRSGRWQTRYELYSEMRWDSCCAYAKDVLYGLKETARKILHPGGSDER